MIIAATLVIALSASVWAVRWASRPLTTLAAAAQRLGLDIGAPPLSEQGPREVRLASCAFNEMQGRLQGFVRDRTQMLAAISHDLRTPITRMRLRAELMDDPDQRRKMLSDLAEMETMIAATLSFARDDPARESPKPLDLAALLQSLVADAADAGAAATYDGPAHVAFTGRPTALRRAFDNLIRNALAYGGCARVTAMAAEDTVTVAVADDGPGIPPEERERVFEPFYRIEGSRSRDTGGVGLGLAVVRSAVRAHGGEVALDPGPSGGLTVTVTLPRGSP
ncbi:MAG: HAMP domain-containing protein [Rhodospirillales bacterium]|nr:MAG: HAMP domain-containing protein [Rhodospirillales bacterium]